jgi:hypothetical protein
MEDSMPYYIRVLGVNSDSVPLEAIEEAAKPARIAVEELDSGDWRVLLLSHESGEEIAVIEKNPVVEGALGHEEIQEFQEEIIDCKPQSGSRWLKEYLPKIQVIYAFQLLDGTDVHDGWSHLSSVKDAIWKIAGGIIQADGEGFSNEEGATVLWQFSDSVTGDWSVGTLSADGQWLHYRMDLGNPAHRQAFWGGKVPEGTELV